MIVLFTDFGMSGPYTGQVKAVLHLQAAEMAVVDLFADAPAGNPRAAAYLLAAFAAWFPAGSVFLAVVDPGVGGARAPLVIEADGRWYVGPDNGLFELVLRRAAVARAFEIVWRPATLSASFHGRDLFAPVAAWLARGPAPAGALREAAPCRFGAWPDDLAEIVYIDHYGNAMTGLRAARLLPTAQLVVRDSRIARAHTFSDVSQGTAFWYENANSLVEIAVNQGRADEVLGLNVGMSVGIVG
jgi:hypothetical protein